MKTPLSAFCFQSSFCLCWCSRHSLIPSCISASSLSASITLCRKSGSIWSFTPGHSAESSSLIVSFCSCRSTCSWIKPDIAGIQPGGRVAWHFREGTSGRVGTSCTAGFWRSTGSHEELDGRCDSLLLPELRERVYLTKLLSSAFLEVELEHYLLG